MIFLYLTLAWITTNSALAWFANKTRFAGTPAARTAEHCMGPSTLCWLVSMASVAIWKLFF